MTIAAEAYEQGREARRTNPEAKLPYISPWSVMELSWAWFEGFSSEPDAPTPYGYIGGRCPFCWSRTMSDCPDGTLRCWMYPCRDQNYPPVNRDEIKFFMGKRDAGSYI